MKRFFVMSLAGSRYLRLMEHLALEDREENPSKPAAKDDPRFAYGWQTRVAEKLGIDQSYVSRLRSGLYEPTIDAVESAQASLRIDYRYFHEKKLTSPHYRDFRAGSKVPPMGYQGWRDFVERMAPTMTPPPSELEIEWLRRQEWDGEPQAITYVHMLTALRTVRTAQTGVHETPSAASA